MAEFVGLAASVITLGAFSITVYDRSKKIYDAIKQIPYLEAEVMQTVLIAQSSSVTIGSCHTSLQNLELKVDKRSVLVKMRGDGVFESLEKAIEMVSRRLEDLVDELESVQSRFAVRLVFKWNSRKPKFDDLGIQLECIKTTVMIIMLITILEHNRLESQKFAKMLKGREMAQVRLAFEQRLGRDNQVHAKNLEQQQKVAKSLMKKKRQADDVPFSPLEPTLEALDRLLDITEVVRRTDRWVPAPESVNANRRSSSTHAHIGFPSAAPPVIVAVANLGGEQSRLTIKSNGSSAARGHLTATIDGRLPPGIGIMRSGAAEKFVSGEIEAVRDGKEVVEFNGGRREPVIGHTTLTYVRKGDARGSHRILTVYVVHDLECDIVVRDC